MRRAQAKGDGDAPSRAWWGFGLVALIAVLVSFSSPLAGPGSADASPLAGIATVPHARRALADRHRYVAGHHHPHVRTHRRQHAYEHWRRGSPAWLQLHGRGATSNPTPAQLLAGAHHLPPGWHASVRTLALGGRMREYLVVEPEHPQGELPVYVVLHGRDMIPDTMLHITHLPDDTGPAVLVFPLGWRRSWNAGGCCGYAHLEGVDDVSFIATVVDDVLASTPAADPDQVWLIGFSNGGRMAYRLACELPDVFAGFAAVEAVPVMHCPSLAPLDIEVIAQRHDPLLTISNTHPRKSMEGYVEPTVQSTVEWWRHLDGCGDDETTVLDAEATVRTWSCADGTRLQYTLYRDGGHYWRPGDTSRILDFFSGEETVAPGEPQPFSAGSSSAS